MKATGKGFSLLELIIALGVAGIIATFAIPAYRTHIAKAHRLDAAALMRAVQFVETSRLSQTPGGDVIALPAGMDRVPSGGGVAAIYALTLLLESASNGGYTIEAAPIASGAMQDDACGIFVIDATGSKTNHTNANEAARSSSCWTGKG
ncbi:Type IV pilus biogeneis protein PilE [Candidatus Paraburkholderia calva]|nr:Type IV pilus biogeneis protein PilE [Candidatus Paraburkholderia calva]